MSAGGIIGTILGYLGYQIGQRTDGASSSGSLHAKVGDLKNYMSSDLTNVINTRSVPMSVYMGSARSPSSGSGQATILNISGPGILLWLRGRFSQYEYQAEVEIQVDGSTLMTGVVSGADSDSFITPYLSVTEPTPILIPFKSSLKLLAETVGPNNPYIYWVYAK